MKTAAAPSIHPSDSDPGPRAWLERFAAAVRGMDYQTGREMFDDNVVAFGTLARMVSGLDPLIEQQWQKIWGCTRGFHFLLDEAHIQTDGDVTWIATPWQSQGRDDTGHWFDRRGRCTLILHRKGGRWLCVHSHYSREPIPKTTGGTPA